MNLAFTCAPRKNVDPLRGSIEPRERAGNLGAPRAFAERP